MTSAHRIIARMPFKIYPQSESATERKIKSFARLPEGWDFGRGHPISAYIIDNSLRIHNEFVFLGISETDAFPSSRDEIVVSGYKNDFYIEYTVEHDGLATFIAKKGDDTIKSLFHIKQSEARSALLETTRIIWNTFDSSIRRYTMIGDEKELIDLHLAPLTGARYQFLILNAFTGFKKESAGIFRDTIRGASGAHRLYGGNAQGIVSQMDA